MWLKRECMKRGLRGSDQSRCDYARYDKRRIRTHFGEAIPYYWLRDVIFRIDDRMIS